MGKGFLLATVLAISCVSSAFAQTTVRTIVWPPNDDPMGDRTVDSDGKYVPSDIRALAIVSIMVEGKKVTIGEPFEAQDDWLKSLTVRVRNTSDRPINSVRIGFGLPETSVGRTGSGFSLEYGRELSTGIDYGEQKAIAPGEEVEIVRNERHYRRDSDGVTNRTGLSNFTQLMIGATTVKFEDGTIWMSRRLRIAE